MKKRYAYLATAMLAVACLTACNDEWEDEQYQQYVSFKAPIGDNGVTDIYVRYKENGKVTYQLPVIVSGSTANNQNRTVHVAVDPDTLNTLNEERFGREDLYYRPLADSFYDFPESIDVPAGTSVVTLPVDFSLKGIDMSEKWVLPLSIADDPAYNYTSHPRKNYAKALLRVLPFNDYSGTYQTTTMQVYTLDENGENTSSTPIVENTRTAYVVDENTVFFYAGVINNDLIERAKYKVNFHFDPDTTSRQVTLSAPNDTIELVQNAQSTYSINEVMDVNQPYLKHRYLNFAVDYTFVDYTSAPGRKIKFRVRGTMTMERKINTQIPDEDQAIEW